MFYGSGAGKLPTASAVVADIVDIAKHLHKNILIEWSSKKVELIDYRAAEFVSFVRTTASKEEVTAAFGEVEFVKADGVTGETAFVSTKMNENEYEDKASKLGTILQRIRMQ